MREHLFQSLAQAESTYPNCGIIIAGDFNGLNISTIKKHFRLKQIVKKPTRKNAILDLILTNMHDYYENPCTFPPFGLSDHNAVTVEGKEREHFNTTKIVYSRDKRASRKAEMGRYLSGVDWPILFSSLQLCEDLLYVFNNVVHTGLQILMPVKRIRVNTTDAPWMTAHVKSLILKRQNAFHKYGTESPQYKFYRNVVNRERKVLKAKFYHSKVEHMKQENPKVWWKEVKRLCGSKSFTDDLINQIQVESIENLSKVELAEAINKAFLDPLEEYRSPQPLNRLPVEESAVYPKVSELQVQVALAKLNPSKACGPDDIPTWLLKEYAILLAYPVSKIINSSFREMKLPSIWKVANVIPLPKVKHVENLNKHLRPISLTACLSKVAENFVVQDYVKPAVLKILDPNQYGAIPKSSTIHALIHMVHVWASETDGNGATVRTILFDYRKAFDLIDHLILVEKLCVLDLPNCVVNWIIDFLSNRLQRTKLADDCFSEWGSVPSGVPQGTKLGPWLFLLLINDLAHNNDTNAYLWKYVDDTTSSEIVAKGHSSYSQNIVDSVAQWSLDNKLILNDEKCKELRVCFARNQEDFQPIYVNGKELEIVKSAKLLGVTVTSDLSWNAHINNVIKKAAKRLYFLVQLKRANLPRKDLVLFYITCIRSILTYAMPVFFYALPKYLQSELERLQKRALSIIDPGLTYHEALVETNIPSIVSYGDTTCRGFFDLVVNDKNNKLNKLLPPIHETSYQLRRNRRFDIPNWSTNRFRDTFIMASAIKNNSHD
jgi:hypothetical protein